LVGLEILDIRDCLASGQISDSIGKLENLSELKLYNTGLSGLVPSALGNLTQLKVLFPGQFGRPNSSKLGELKEFVCL
jgi:hypothetical protein